MLLQPTSDALPPPARWRMPPFLRWSIAWHALAIALMLLVPGALLWAVLAIVLNHVAITAAGLTPRSTLLGANVTRLPPSAVARGEVAITIDDGPDPQVTPAVLDILDAAGQHATFFCIAERVQAFPALAREIVARGHTVENHTARHRHDFSFLGARAYAAEIGRAQAIVTQAVGRAPGCFRAPAGFRNIFLAPVLHRMGLTLVSWTRRGFDTREGDAAKVLARLARGLAAGDILLLHDGHAAHTPDGRPVVLAVLPPLLARIRQAGLRSVTLSQGLAP